MSLRSRKMSPQSKIRERNGFVTSKVVPDCFEAKKSKALDDMHAFDLKTNTSFLLSQHYKPPKPHRFRDEVEIEPGMVDFMLRSKPPGIENPNGLSVFCDKPKYISDKRRAEEQKAEELRLLKEANKPQEWLKYYKLNHKKVEMTH